MKTKPVSFRSRCNSIRFAVNGIRRFIREEPNARLHLVATVMLAITACCLPVSGNEAIALVIVTGSVWLTEALNTAIERIMDMISPEFDPRTGFIKDLSAGAVLIASVAALITGLIIFTPKILVYVTTYC